MHNIFIHGLGQNSSSWAETISCITEQEHILCPELSLLLKDKDVTYSNLYKSFSTYCDSLSGELNLCGLSLGGVLSLNYACDNPSKVKSLVLIATQYKMPKGLLKFQNIIFNFMPKSTFKSMGMEKYDFINLTNSMISLDFSDSLKNISCPVLVICGEKDIPNKKASNNLFNIIKDAEISFIKNANHEVNVDAPNELAEVINDFFDRY